MKSVSNNRPDAVLDLGNGKYHFNYNISEGINEEKNPVFEYDTIEIREAPTYENIVKAIIRNSVSETEEFALVNKYQKFALGISEDESDKSNYVQFLTMVDTIKDIVKQTLNTDEI